MFHVFWSLVLKWRLFFILKIKDIRLQCQFNAWTLNIDITAFFTIPVLFFILLFLNAATKNQYALCASKRTCYSKVYSMNYLGVTSTKDKGRKLTKFMSTTLNCSKHTTFWMDLQSCFIDNLFFLHGATERRVTEGTPHLTVFCRLTQFLSV